MTIRSGAGLQVSKLQFYWTIFLAHSRIMRLPAISIRVKAHRRGGRELGPPRAERKTMIMRESTGDDVGISPKLD